MPEGYTPNPTIIRGGTGTGNILQVRRSKMGRRVRRSKRSKRSNNALRKVGALT